MKVKPEHSLKGKNLAHIKDISSFKVNEKIVLSIPFHKMKFLMAMDCVLQ